MQGEGMVRFLEGLVRGEGWCGNSSGSRPNFFGDSTSPLTRGGKNVVRSEGGASNPSGSRPNFFGDSTSPLTREASVMVWGKGWCGDLSVVDFCTATEKIGYCAVPD